MRKIFLTLFVNAIFLMYSAAQTQVDWFNFSKDYYPGTYDLNNKFLGGTDLMYLVNHKGKLWAGTSVWNDKPGTDPAPGPQILVKETSSSNWKVDTSMGNGYLRTDALYSFIFKKDKFGNTLPRPDTLLMAGFSDLTAPYDVCVWVRDDATGNWVKTVVYPNVGAAESSYIRHMNLYTDKITGVQHVFAAGITAVVRGAYNPFLPGKIEWQGIEITGPQRMLSSTICNGDYYIAFATDGNPTNNNGGIFRRNDGASPTWTSIYEWPDTGNVSLGRNCRGINAVKDPNGGNHQVMVGVLENLRSSMRFDPVYNTQTVEVNWQHFFETEWGSSITAFNYAAYNNTISIIAPDNADTCLLMGAWVTYPAAYGTVNRNNSWYLIRRPNGNWHYGQIMDSLNPIPPGNGLAATRTIIKSPFTDEPHTYYFGGKDAGGPNPVFHNTAWIYKGVLATIPTGLNATSLGNSIIIYPNPTNTMLFIKAENNHPLQYQITNSIGQVMQQANGNGNGIDVSSLSSGIYFVRLMDEKGRFFISKFIKE